MAIFSSSFFKILILSVFVGLSSGVLSSAFLHSLNFVTQVRQLYPELIWGLPLFGFIFGLFIKIIPHHINQGIPYILDGRGHEKKISPWIIPFIFISSIGTHLFGGSAGREGVGVIMGAGAAQLLPRLNSSYINMRHFLIYTGIAAGFSSIFGTPLAAIAFAFELHSYKDIKKLDLLFSTTLASFVALIVAHFLGPTHHSLNVSFQFNEIIPYLIIAIISSGLGAIIFYWGMKFYTKFISSFISRPEWKLSIGAILICLIVQLTTGYQFVGIGTDLIAKSFQSSMSYYDFGMKALLTIMTLSIGFKGGEVTPLFCMGATLSNSTGSLFGLHNFGLSSSLGMVSLFGAVTATPIASAIMGAELFGPEIGCICLITCVFSRKFMGKKSIYQH